MCCTAWGADTIFIKSGHLFGQHDGARSAMASELSEVADVHVSYDAATILVSAKKTTADHWQIFELNTDGQKLRQVTNCPSDCLHGAYLADGKIACSVRANGGSYIAVSNADGSGLERITFGPAAFDLEGVLPDGRLLLSEGQTLYGIRPDGTMLESIRCDHGSAGVKRTDTQRVELVAQPRPRILWSTLKPESGVGHLISLDSRISSPDLGGTLKTAPRSVRIKSLDASGKVIDLGTAPVETDGSFFVAVPADRAVRFELLDGTGNVVRREKTWIWARPGEERGCVGCHAEKAVAPQNNWPMTLKRFDTPTPLTGEVHATK